MLHGSFQYVRINALGMHRSRAAAPVWGLMSALRCFWCVFAPGAQSCERTHDFMVSIGFWHERAVSALCAVHRISRRVEDRAARPLRVKTLGHFPAGRRSDEIDISEYDVDRDGRLAQRDRLFSASGFDNDVAGLSQTLGDGAPNEEFILDHEDNEITLRRSGHVPLHATKPLDLAPIVSLFLDREARSGREWEDALVR